MSEETRQSRVTEEVLAIARDWWQKATPEQVAAMRAAQRESFIRAMAPCEHGDPDWETCPECLEGYARRRAHLKDKPDD